MVRRYRQFVSVALFALCAACDSSGGHSANPSNTAYLMFARAPGSDSNASITDAGLVALGHRACIDMDNGLRSDAVVADLSGEALPGSAQFNAAAIVVAAAARTLCPQHAAAFSGAAPAGTDN